MEGGRSSTERRSKSRARTAAPTPRVVLQDFAPSQSRRLTGGAAWLEVKPKIFGPVILLGSQALARPDGRAALMLLTDRLGSIAFEVDQQRIETLRRDLAIAEQYLRQPTAK